MHRSAFLICNSLDKLRVFQIRLYLLDSLVKASLTWSASFLPA
jgi:hypothetical protein